MVTDDALPSTLDSFKDAIAAGADRDTAFGVALAKFRALHPCADEDEVRALLARALAEERIALKRAG